MKKQQQGKDNNKNAKKNNSTTTTTTTTTTTSALPALPDSLELVDTSVYRGPTPYTNWIIPNRFICGSFPRSKTLRPLIDLGVSVFINLTQNNETERYGAYFEYAQSKNKKKQLQYIHFPIYDHSIAKDVDVIELVAKIEHFLLNTQELVFIHCVGGHGRTGTIVSLVLAKLYELDSFTAMQWCQVFHDAREITNARSSPESSEQRGQIHKLVPKIVKSQAPKDDE